MFDLTGLGKKLAIIARDDGCSIEEAAQRCIELYRTIQVGVWERGQLLGVVDGEGQVLGIIAGKEQADIDPNFEIDLD